MHLSSDQELLVAYKQSSDRAYIGELYMRYSHMVLGLSLNYLKDRHLAKDAVMDIFEYLIKNVQKYDIDSFKSWILMLTRNHCLKLLTRSLKKESELFDKNIDTHFVEYAQEEDHDNEDELNKLETALVTLKPHQQKCLVLFYLQGKSYDEVAQVTGFDVKKVKSYIQNGKMNLKKRMTP